MRKVSLAGNESNAMTIVTSYKVPIRGQILPPGEASAVDRQLVDATGKLCLEALTFCVHVYLDHWDELSSLSSKERRSAAEDLIHSTKTVEAVYPEFDAAKHKCR